MIKKTGTIVLIMLCLFLFVSAVLAETRQGVIALEGQEEPIEETLFESSQGFSFWYANDTLDAYPGEKDNIEGVVVATIYSGDYMVLSMIPEEEAKEYIKNSSVSILQQSDDSRTQTELYREVKQGRIHFLTLIAENGQYCRAVGAFYLDAAEGNAKYFDRVLDSVTFTPNCPLLPSWGTQMLDETGHTEVILKALEPVTDVYLLKLNWDGVTVSWEKGAPIGNLDAKQQISIKVEFIGDMPNNGIMYTDGTGAVHTFALDISGEDGHLFFWDIME